jgi:hypothetical protein
VNPRAVSSDYEAEIIRYEIWMGKFVGELLFEIAKSFIEGWVNSFLRQAAQKILAWLDTKVHGRARVVFGLVLGLAAAGFFPMMALLLPH